MKSTFSRLEFLKLTAKSLLAFSLGSYFPGLRSASAREAGLDTSLDASYVRQLITKDASASRTIMWQSADPQDGAQVVCRRKGDSRLFAVRAAAAPFQDDGVGCYIHTARLSPLQPGIDYEYRMICSEQGTPWYALHTPDAGAFQALIFPDSQCSDGYVTWRNIAQNAAARNPKASFFINMGDLVDNGEDHNQWQDWFNALAGIIDRLPFAPVMGNHAAYNLNWKCRLPVAWLHYFSVPDNGSEKFRRYYYSFDYGPVHFTVLNNLWEELDPLQPGLLAEEIPWLRADIAASKAKWNIVLMHKDVINYDCPNASDPVRGDIDPVGQKLMPVFDELGIDVVLTAHQHTYRRLGHIFGFHPAAQGPLYIDTGNAGNVRYNVPVNKRFDQKILPQPEVDNYMTLEASAAQLTFRCFQPDGSLADQYTLSARK